MSAFQHLPPSSLLHRASRATIAACSLVSALACSSGSSLAPPPGTTWTPDDGGAVEAGGNPEGGVEGDAAADGDADPPPQLGLTWPPDRSFPQFAPFTTLDVVDISAMGADSLYLFCSLQGLVNRTQPRIYLEKPTSEGETFWVDKLRVTTNAVSDPMTLVVKYRKEISGVVVYDPALIDTVNLATTAAAVHGAIVASPTLAKTLSASPYALPVVADFTKNHFSTPESVYQYELATYASQATTRLIVGLNPGVADALRDYAVATKAMVVWLDPTNATQLSTLKSYLSGLDSNAPYMGWWTNEAVGVDTAAQYGVPVFAADFSRNLTVFGAPHPITSPPAPPAPALENKAYVAIFMSDGDNLQEDQHLIPVKWADPNRGKVPISWTVQPALVDVAPVMLDYYWSTATSNDVLVSGPSGLGYTYPRSWPLQKLGEYTLRSADYLSRGGLGVVTVWNDGPILSGPPANLYAANMPHLLGVTDQHGGGGWSTVDGTLPLLVFASAYASSEAALESGIDQQLAAWNKSAPIFVAVQGNMNQAAINPTTFLAVQQHYASNASVVFVRADHLFRLLRKQAHLPENP